MPALVFVLGLREDSPAWRRSHVPAPLAFAAIAHYLLDRTDNYELARPRRRKAVNPLPMPLTIR